jgi:hypothetical protein
MRSAGLRPAAKARRDSLVLDERLLEDALERRLLATTRRSALVAPSVAMVDVAIGVHRAPRR